jgi:hypothetical protein
MMHVSKNNRARDLKEKQKIRIENGSQISQFFSLSHVKNLLYFSIHLFNLLLYFIHL